MAAVHDINGYTLVLDKIVHISKIFDAPNNEGSQFNIKLSGNTLLKMKFPDITTATLQRELLVKAIKAS